MMMIMMIMINRLVLRQAVQKWSSSSSSITIDEDVDNNNNDGRSNFSSPSPSSLKEMTTYYSLLANSILQWFSSHANNLSTLPENIISSK